MPVTCKSTYFFNNKKPNGWTETLYYSADTLNAAHVASQQLAPLRCAFLSSDSSLVYLRTAAVPVAAGVRNIRNVIITDYESNPLPTASWPGAYAWNALLLRCSGGGKTRPWYLRDLPSEVANEEVGALSFTDFATPYTAWVAALLQMIPNPGMFIINPGLSQTPIALTAISRGTDGGTVVATAVPHGFISGQTVRLSKIKTFAQLNKSFRILVIDASTFSLVNTPFPVPEVTTVPGQGYVSATVKQYQVIVAITPERIVHRIVGRPFGLQAGRKKAKF